MRNWMPAASARRPHHPVQGVDLPHKMALAEAADGWIAAHFTNGFELVGEQQGARAESSRRRGCLAAGMSSADDNYIPGHKAAHIG